jgi:hypothetical protein
MGVTPSSQSAHSMGDAGGSSMASLGHPCNAIKVA